MKGFLVTFLISASVVLIAAFDESMIPEDALPTLKKCTSHAGMTIDECMEECMIMEDESLAKCGKFAWCIAREYEFINENGDLDINKALEESKNNCERLGLDVDLDEMAKCTEPCTNTYTANLAKCGSQDEKELTMAIMMQCIVDDCILPNM